MLTDPQAPRHHNLGYFIIPSKTRGVEMVPMRLLADSNHQFIYYNDVWVSDDCLIGGEREGWQVMQTSLEEEHGGRGRSIPIDLQLETMISCIRNAERMGKRLGSIPDVQDLVAQLYIDSRVRGLLAARNYSMYAKRMELTYEGSQVDILDKEAAIRFADCERMIYGPYAQMSKNDPVSPYAASGESRDRWLPPHAGGSLEIQKTIVARRLGISRTREVAAKTPSTATEFSS
jgi:alkylation response protein AidB-like acyl-CoA dehydrogenase